MSHQKVTTILVFCPDPRFVWDHGVNLTEELDLLPGQFTFLPVLGGASVLARPDQFQKEFESIIEQIIFFLAEFPSVRTVVLVNHEDCRRTKLDKTAGQADLQEAAANLRSMLSPQSAVDIELWYGALEGDGLCFEEVLQPAYELA